MKVIKIQEHTLIDMLLGDIASHDKIDTEIEITRVELEASPPDVLQRRLQGLQEWLNQRVKRHEIPFPEQLKDDLKAITEEGLRKVIFMATEEFKARGKFEGIPRIKAIVERERRD